MKRIFLVILILLAAGFTAYTQQQQQELPNTAQTKQTAQQYLDNSRNTYSDFETAMDELKDRNGSNGVLITFNRIKAEMDRLEATIWREEASVRANLDRGTKVSSGVIDRIDRMMSQYRAKQDELDEFLQTH